MLAGGIVVFVTFINWSSPFISEHFTDFNIFSKNSYDFESGVIYTP